MSIIAYKIEKDKVRVACDGRCVAGDEIIAENRKKIEKAPSEKIICGATGSADINELWRNYVATHEKEIRGITTTSETLKLAVDFRTHLIDDFGFGDDSFAINGAFFFITPDYHCVINYDVDKAPYLTHNNKDENYGCFGATDMYTDGLMDGGIDMVEAIRISAKKFASINDNVYELSFDF